MDNCTINYTINCTINRNNLDFITIKRIKRDDSSSKIVPKDVPKKKSYNLFDYNPLIFR